MDENKRNNLDLSVYFVADLNECKGNLVDIVKDAVRGGVSMVQLRDKTGNKDRLSQTARTVGKWLNSYNKGNNRNVSLLINDYVDVAKETDADGVHVGQNDMAAQEARDILGNNKIIGVTAFTPEHFSMLDPAVIDYAGTGPFYETKTDKGKPVLGKDRFAELVKLSPVPVVGIGGITPFNAREVFAAGAKGVAMIRSISFAQSPHDVAAEFLQICREAQETKDTKNT